MLARSSALFSVLECFCGLRLYESQMIYLGWARRVLNSRTCSALHRSCQFSAIENESPELSATRFPGSRADDTSRRRQLAKRIALPTIFSRRSLRARLTELSASEPFSPSRVQVVAALVVRLAHDHPAVVLSLEKVAGGDFNDGGWDLATKAWRATERIAARQRRKIL